MKVKHAHSIVLGAIFSFLTLAKKIQDFTSAKKLVHWTTKVSLQIPCLLWPDITDNVPITRNTNQETASKSLITSLHVFRYR